MNQQTEKKIKYMLQGQSLSPPNPERRGLASSRKPHPGYSSGAGSNGRSLGAQRDGGRGWPGVNAVVIMPRETGTN